MVSEYRPESKSIKLYTFATHNVYILQYENFNTKDERYGFFETYPVRRKKTVVQ